jgi:two-component system sensor histidine kinase/response regulator
VTSEARILIVDDDPALLEALPAAVHIRMQGIAIDTCESAVAAVEHIQSGEYDAIVSDIKMPGMDGLALLAVIKEKRPATPTLLITGHGEDDLGARAMEGGAFEYFSKPIDRDAFITSLERAIRWHRNGG